LSAPLSKATKVGWRKDTKRPRDAPVDDGDDNVMTQHVVTFPRQRLQSHTAYLTFARLVPEPEGWAKTLAERSKNGVGGDLLARAAEVLQRNRRSGRDSPAPRAPKAPNKNMLSNPGEYSD
jgi:tRNA (adenine57-N1/adenine58-N1)-methyltransferase